MKFYVVGKQVLFSFEILKVKEGHKINETLCKFLQIQSLYAYKFIF